MSNASFIQSFIQEQINLSKNKFKSKFNSTLAKILSEEEQVGLNASTSSLAGTPEVPADNPKVNATETSLPPENTDIQIKMAQIAALALLTDMEKFASGNSDEIYLSRMKNDGVTGKEDSINVLRKVVKFIRAGGNKLGFDIDENFVEKFDAATHDALTNLVIKVLFISKDKLLQNNTSLSKIIDDIGGLLSQIKPIQSSDPVAAVEIAAKIVQKINSDIIPSADLTI